MSEHKAKGKRGKEKVRIISSSALLTKKIAKEFIHDILRSGKGPYIFLLKGDLGSGKTTFALGVLSYFGIHPHAASPTFVIAKHYRAKTSPPTSHNSHHISDIWHVDAYRLRSKKDLDILGLPLSDPHAVFLIEWPERVKLRSTKGAFVIHFCHGSRINERIIEINKK